MRVSEILFRRKNLRTIQVEFAWLPSDLCEYFVSLKKLESLSRKNHKNLIESPSDFHVVVEDTVFSYLKPGGIPRIVQVKSLEVNPDYATIVAHLDQEELFRWANLNRITVLETEDSYVIPGGSMMYIAAKQDKPRRK